MINLSFPSSNKIRSNLANQIKSILRSYLNERGYEGDWEAELFKKTGENTTEKIELRKISKENQYAVYAVRPFDKSSSWRITVRPPKGFDIEQLNEKAVTQEVETPTEEVEEPTVNQLRKARIVTHLQHGMEILIDEKYEGFIPLQDVSESYDKKDLNRYPVGSLLRVVIADTSKPYPCTIRTDGIATTTSKNDLFSGQPDSDGRLSLLSYTKDPNRIHEFVQVFSIIAESHKPKSVPYEEAIKWMTDFFKDKYKAKDIHPKGVLRLFTTICHSRDTCWIKKTQDGYEVTEEGWIEVSHQAPEVIQAVALEPELEKAEAVTKQVESRLQPIVEHLEPIHAQPTLDDLITYIRKSQRLVDVTEERRMLDKEITELKDWLDNNLQLKMAADTFYNQMAKDGKNVLDER